MKPKRNTYRILASLLLLFTSIKLHTEKVSINFDRILPQTQVSTLVEQTMKLWGNINELYRCAHDDEDYHEQLSDMVVGKLTRLFHSLSHMQSASSSNFYLPQDKAEYLLSIFYHISHEHHHKKCHVYNSELIGHFIERIETLLFDIIEEH